MSYGELDPSASASANYAQANVNWRQGHFLNKAFLAAADSPFDVWSDDTDGSPIDVYICDASDGAIEVDLPAGGTGDAAAGRTVIVLKSDASGNRVTAKAHGSETIGGSPTLVLSTQGACAQLVFGASSWHVLGSV